MLLRPFIQGSPGELRGHCPQDACVAGVLAAEGVPAPAPPGGRRVNIHTSRAGIDRSQKSRMVRIRRRRPDSRLSLTKSMPFARHARLALAGTTAGHRDVSWWAGNARTDPPRGYKSLRPFVIHHKRLMPQQDMQPLHAEATPFLRQFPQASAQLRIPLQWKRTPHSAAADAQCRTGTPLGGSICRLDILYRLSA